MDKECWLDADHARNLERLSAWRRRWHARFGSSPDETRHQAQVICGFAWPLPKRWPEVRELGPGTVSPKSSYGNGHIVKVPRHRRQYVGAALRAGPDGP